MAPGHGLPQLLTQRFPTAEAADAAAAAQLRGGEASHDQGLGHWSGPKG